MYWLECSKLSLPMNVIYFTTSMTLYRTDIFDRYEIRCL